MNTLPFPERKIVLSFVNEELDKQARKWGEERILDAHLWLTILGEEFGEACRAKMEDDPEAFIAELVDVAAVAISAIRSTLVELRAASID